ncbi:GWxTD domain-containing protein, partial [Gemmatimonadota bacterium]
LGLHYLLTEEWASAAQVMNYIVNQGVHTAEALLGRGLALQHLGFMEEAWRNYTAGIQALPENIQMIAIDPRWIMPPSTGGIQHRGRGSDRLTLEARPDTTDTGYAQASADTFFWRSRDPLFSTEVNERLLEHFRRFAYVSWIFASENLGLKGWDTLRGQIYLRYGTPRSSSNQQNAIQGAMTGRLEGGGSEGMSSLSSVSSMLDAMLDAQEFWRYEGFTFAFGGGFLSGNLTLGPAPRYPGGPEYIDTQREFSELLESTPESAKVEGSIDILPLEVTWYRFQSPTGDTEFIPVIHFMNLPGELIRSSVRTIDYPMTFILLDDTWSMIESRQEKVTVTRWTTPQRRFAVGPLLSPAGVSQPDRISFGAVEHMPADREVAYATRDTLDRPSGSSLELSSLIIANQVEASDQSAAWPEGSFITRNDIFVSVRPTNHFSLNEPVYLYFEVYGLGKDDFGATSYELELTVEASRSSQSVSAIVRFAQTLFDQETTQQGRVTLVTQRSGISTDAQEHLRIAFPVGQQADIFIVTVGVIDLVTGQRSERTIQVRMGG